MDFKERVISYLARNIHIFDSQVPGEGDPDIDTLLIVAEGLGISEEVTERVKFHEEDGA